MSARWRSSCPWPSSWRGGPARRRPACSCRWPSARSSAGWSPWSAPRPTSSSRSSAPSSSGGPSACSTSRPSASPMVHKTVAELEALGDSDVRVTTVIREKFRRYTPTAQWTLHAGDLLLLKGEAEDLERVIARARLRLPAAEDAPAAPAPSDKHGVVEGVIMADSPLIGRSPAQVHLRQRYGVNLLALSRSGCRITQRLRSLKFRLGDVLVLQGERDMLREALGELGVLPLAQRNIALGQGRRGDLPGFAPGS